MAKTSKKPPKSKTPARKAPAKSKPVGAKKPAARGKAATKKPAARKAVGGGSARGRSADWRTRLAEITVADMSDAERFHAVSALIAQSVGAAFVNLYAANAEGQPELVGAHEKAVSYYRDIEEKSGPVLDNTRAIPAAGGPKLADAPGTLPVFGIEESGPVRITDTSASSAILIPYLVTKEQIGILIAAVQEPQPHYTETELDAVRRMSAILAEQMVRRAMMARAQAARGTIRDARRSADEQKQEALQSARELENLRAEHAAQATESQRIATELAASEAARQAREQELTSLRSAHVDDLSQLSAQKEAAARQAVQEITERATRAESDARESRAALETQVRVQSEQLLSEARAQHEQARVQAQEKAQGELTQLKQAHEAELLKTLERQEEDRRSITDLRGQVQTLQQELREAQAGAELQIQKLRNVQAEQLKREKAELEELFSDEIKTLQERLQGETKDRARETDELRQKVQKTGGDYEEAQRTLDRTRAELKEALEKSHHLEQTLSGTDSELKRREAGFQRELQAIRSQLEAEIAAGSAKEEAATGTNQALQQELTETRKHLEDYRSTYEETKSNFQRQLSQSEQRQEELKQTLEKERQEADRERSQLQARVEELGTALQQRETDLLAEKHRISEQLAAREKDLQRARIRLPELEEQVRGLSSRLQQTEAEHEQGRGRIDALATERDDLIQQVRRLERDGEREATRFTEETARHEEVLARERAEAEAASTELKNRTTAAENRALVASRDLEGLRVELEKLRGELRESRRESETTMTSLAERTASLESIQYESNHQRLKLEKMSGELDELRGVEQDLRSQIGIHRDRETRLEQTVASMREREHALKSEASALEERIRELERSADAQLELTAGLQGDLSEELARVRKLDEELKNALTRERGSRESGNLIAHITNAISNISGLSPKLDFLRKRALPEREFDRILLFSLLDDDSLRFEDGYQGETNLGDYRGFRIPLRETIFGQAVASGRAAVETVSKKGPGHPDLSGPLLEFLEPDDESARLQTLIFVPLREAERVVGLLSFASSTAGVPDDSRVELLEQIGPLIAVSLRFEQNRAELEREHSVRSYADNVNRYFEHRFVNSVRRLHRIADGLGTVAHNAREELSQELLTDVQVCAEAVVPALDRADGPADFTSWLRNLAIRAEQKAGLTVVASIDETTVSVLHRTLGHGFHNLFWVAEEAVENVIRHSKAKQLKIRIEEGAGFLSFSITDDGDGLMRTAGTLEPTKGTGLPAIRNLLGNCGATLQLGKDENGYGLSIGMTWPLDYRDA